MPQTQFVSAVPQQVAVGRRSRWNAGRITALAVGCLLTLLALGFLSTGSTLIWADRTQRDAGFLTAPATSLSTSGAAIVTEPTDLGSGGTGWWLTPGLLGEIRVRVTPTEPSRQLFVGIGPSADVERYLSGVGQGYIDDYFHGGIQQIPGSESAPEPATQKFWVASSTGEGARSLSWNPVKGSWSVVVMNADGTGGLSVSTDLGAKVPAVPWIGVGLAVTGLVFLVGGLVLVVGAVRRKSMKTVAQDARPESGTEVSR